MVRIVGMEEVSREMDKTFKRIFDPKLCVSMRTNFSGGQPGVVFSFIGRDPFNPSKELKSKELFMNVSVDTKEIESVMIKYKNIYLGIERMPK